MKFSFNKSLEILESTPMVISALLINLSDEWTEENEGEGTWTAKEVVAHLIVCEETNWLSRTRVILYDSVDKIFVPIDMALHFKIADTNMLPDLIDQFKNLRESSLSEIKGFNLQEEDFLKIAIHPKIGEVSLQELISAWVTHDLTHIAQISRVIAKQNIGLVGGFSEYLKILKYS